MSKPHSLPRLSKSYLESPQLITEAKFREIAEVLDNREYFNSYKENLFFDWDEDDQDKEYSDFEACNIGLLKVEGPTTYKPTGWEALCGGCSYKSLLEQMQEHIDNGKKTVLMWINSPGGQAYRLMSTSKKLRDMADKADVKLIGYIDGLAASAGYGLASSCHELVINPDAEAGSVGVVISLINDSKHLEKEGFERTFITAGEEKVPYKDNGEFREEFVEDLQEKVDSLYTKFTSHVAKMRNIEVDTVIGTQAKVLKAEKSLEIGFVDKIMEEDEFLQYLGVENNSTTDPELDITKDTTMSVNDKETLSQEEFTKLQDELKQKEEKLASLEAAAQEKAELEKRLAEYEQKEAQAYKESLEKSLSQHSFLGDAKAEVLDFLLSEGNEKGKELMSKVLDSASASLSSKDEEVEGIKEEASKKEAELNQKVSEMEAKLENFKDSFSEEEGADGDVTVNTTVDQKASVAEILAKRKAAKASK